jgi:lipopolysaccharide export system permease protein
MKILDKYLIKRFATPFLATFLVVLFVLVILTIWQSLDKISGKGLSTIVILRYLGYTALMVTPQALPIGILLSSIMAMGTLSENYEYAAIKSAGVSLFRLLRPLAIFMIVLSGLNFLFLNFVFPFASFESLNLMQNIKKKQPAMALVAGSFNSDIPGYSIKFSEKYGEKQNLLKDVIIYDLTEKKYNNVVITSKFGEIKSTPNSKYMTLVLKDGHYYKDLIAKRNVSIKKDKMPFIKSHFDEHQINFDISGLDDLDTDKKYKQQKQMLSLSQLKEIVVKKQQPLNKELINLKKKYYKDIKANKLAKDTIAKDTTISINILSNFTNQNKLKILKRASSTTDYAVQSIKNSKQRIKKKKLKIRAFQVEYHHRISFAFACLVLFLIGAPLGSIIRKGGIGVPMISAVVIYVIFHFMGVLSRGMADTGELAPWLGAWLPTMIMLPFGIFLNFRAINDKGLFNLGSLITSISNYFKRFKKEKVIS